MPSITSHPPSPLPTLPFVSESPHSFLIGIPLRRKEKNANPSEAQQGNLPSLETLAYYDSCYPSRRNSLVEIPTFKKSSCRLHKAEVKVHDRLGEWSRLPSIEAGENLGFIKENGRMPTFDDISLVKLNSAFPLDAEEEDSHLVKKHEGLPGREVGSVEEVDDFHKRIEMFSPGVEVQNLVRAEMKDCNSSKVAVGVVDALGEDGRNRVERHNKVVNFVKENGRLPTMEEMGILHSDWRSGSLDIKFSNLLTELIGDNELELATNLISGFLSCAISLDSRSYSIMIQLLCRINELDQAKHVLHDMIRNGFHPKVGEFTHVIHCFCKKGRLQRAFEVFHMMSQIGCEPTVRTYNCLIGGLCYVGRVEEAFQLLKKIQISSQKPDIYSFTAVMDGFCKVGRSDEAKELLKEAIGTGLKPTVVTYNVLLNGYCKEGWSMEGFSLLEEMRGRDCQPDIITFSTLLQGLLKWHETTAALNMYNQMTEFGFQIEERSMNTLLRGVCRQSMVSKGLLKEAHQLLKRISKMEPYTYCLVIEALGRGGEIDEAMNYLLEMVKMGYPPRTMTYNVIIRTLCREGRVDDAMLVLIIMIRRCTTPSNFSFSMLFNEFKRQGRSLDACGTYAAALKRGVILHQKPIKQF